MPSKTSLARLIAGLAAIVLIAFALTGPADARNRTGAFLGGLAAGAIIGGIVAGAPSYAAPPPPPVYVAPGPVYDDAVAYCMRRFRSYNPHTGTYMGYDGIERPCP